MADISKYLRALQKADAAGNVEDAKALAKHIRQLQAQQQQDSSKDEEESSGWEDFKSSVQSGLKTAKSGWDLLAGGLAGIAGDTKASEKIFSEAEQRQEEAKKLARGGVGGTLGQVVAGIPGIVAAPAASALETYRTLSENPNVSPRQAEQAAQKAGVFSGLANAYGVTPGGLGASLVRGGASSLMSSLGSDVIKAQTAKKAGDTESGKYIKDLPTYAEEVALNAAILGGVHAAGKGLSKVLPKKPVVEEVTGPDLQEIQQKTSNVADTIYEHEIASKDVQQPGQMEEGFVSPYGRVKEMALDENGMPVDQTLSQDVQSQQTIGDLADQIKQEYANKPTVLPDDFQTVRELKLNDGPGDITYDAETNNIVAHNANGDVVGTIKLSHRPGTLGVGEKAEIDIIQTNPNYRGQGIATQMSNVFKEMFGEDNIQPSKAKTDEGLAFAHSFWGTKQRGAIKFFDTDRPRAKSGEKLIVEKISDYDRLVSQDVPWDDATRNRMLQPGREAGYTEGSSKDLGVFQNRQAGMLKNSLPLKWATDQINISKGKTRAFINEVLYGSEAAFGKGFTGKLLKGFPSTIDTDKGAYTALSELPKDILNEVATSAHMLDQQNLPRRASVEELSSSGIKPEVADALHKFWGATDKIIDGINTSLKAAGRENEMITPRTHYAPAVRQGQWQLPVYDNQGSLIAAFDFKDRADFAANKANINNLLRANGYDLNNVSWSEGMLAPISEKFVMPAGEQYFNKNGIYIGTGAKAYMTPKKGVLGTAGSYGENAGVNFLEAFQKYADSSGRFLNRIDMQSRLKPMLEDPEIQANYKQSADRIVREMNTFTGGGRKENIFSTIDRNTKNITRRMTGGEGHSLSDMVGWHNAIFYALKITGKGAKFAYDNAVQRLLSGLPREVYLKSALESKESIIMGNLKATYDLMSNKYTLDQRSLLSTMAERDLIDQAEARAMMHSADAYSTYGQKSKKFVDKTTDMLARFEHVGRAHLALSLDNVLKKVIPDAKTRHETIMNHVTDTFVDQSPEAASLMFKEQPLLVSTLASPLTRFPTNDIGQLLMYAKHAGKDISPILAYVGTRALMGGAVTVPGIKAYNWLAQQVNEHTDQEMPSTDQMFRNLPDAVRFGIPSWGTGLDLSGGAKSSADFDYPMFAAGHWGADFYTDVAKALSGDYNKMFNLAKTLSPGSTKQLVDYAQQQQYKNILKDKGLVVPDEDLLINRKGEQVASAPKGTFYNPATTTLGAQSLAQTKAEIDNQIIFNLEKQFNTKKSGLYDKLYTAWEQDDEEAKTKIMRRIVDTYIDAGIRDGKRIDAGIESALVERFNKKRMSKEQRDIMKEGSSQQMNRLELMYDQ